MHSLLIAIFEALEEGNRNKSGGGNELANCKVNRRTTQASTWKQRFWPSRNPLSVHHSEIKRSRLNQFKKFLQDDV